MLASVATHERNPPHVRSRGSAKPARRSASMSCLSPEQRTRGPLHVPDELVDLTGRRGGESLDVLALRRNHALAGEENQDGWQDGEIREQRIDLAERAFALPLDDDVAHR